MTNTLNQQNKCHDSPIYVYLVRRQRKEFLCRLTTLRLVVIALTGVMKTVAYTFATENVIINNIKILISNKMSPKSIHRFNIQVIVFEMHVYISLKYLLYQLTLNHIGMQHKCHNVTITTISITIINTDSV